MVPSLSTRRLFDADDDSASYRCDHHQLSVHRLFTLGGDLPHLVSAPDPAAFERVSVEGDASPRARCEQGCEVSPLVRMAEAFHANP